MKIIYYLIYLIVLISPAMALDNPFKTDNFMSIDNPFQSVTRSIQSETLHNGTYQLRKTNDVAISGKIVNVGGVRFL